MFVSAAAELAAIFGSASRAGGRRLPPTSMAGGLRNWLPQEGGLKAWANAAHKKLKSDASVAALCAALRYAEYMRQITMPGVPFDRMLSQWNLVFPSNGLSLVNALRSASTTKQKLAQELCVLTPPGQRLANSPCRNANDNSTRNKFLMLISLLLQGFPQISRC